LVRLTKQTSRSHHITSCSCFKKIVLVYLEKVDHLHAISVKKQMTELPYSVSMELKSVNCLHINNLLQQPL